MPETRARAKEEFVKKLDTQLQSHIVESSKKFNSHDSKFDELGRKLDILIKRLIPPQDGILGSAPRDGNPQEGSASRPRGCDKTDQC